jgi:hypothetical protein
MSGPLFDGGWETAVDDLVSDMTADLGDHARTVWLGNLNSRIRVNQGRYVSQVNVARPSRSEAVVNDNRSLYGPWLEGTGSRNFPVTRFRGYRSAADAVVEVDATAVEVVQPRVDAFTKEMNG